MTRDCICAAVNLSHIPLLNDLMERCGDSIPNSKKGEIEFDAFIGFLEKGVVPERRRKSKVRDGTVVVIKFDHSVCVIFGLTTRFGINKVTYSPPPLSSLPCTHPNAHFARTPLGQTTPSPIPLHPEHSSLLLIYPQLPQLYPFPLSSPSHPPLLLPY